MIAKTGYIFDLIITMVEYIVSPANKSQVLKRKNRFFDSKNGTANKAGL